jgi:SAM-dependent methyltransferase
LGTYYRSLILERLTLVQGSSLRVLDVGSHDGYILSRFPARLKIGVDLAPADSTYWPIWPANALRLPFASGTFDLVIALDVIEHVTQDEQLLRSLVRVLATGGVLWLSTPSAGFRIFPQFLTDWLSRQWGHLVVGYTHQQLARKLPADVDATWLSWHAPFYRLLYFPLRVLWAVARPLAKWLVRHIVHLDTCRAEGHSGFIFGCVRKNY